MRISEDRSTREPSERLSDREVDPPLPLLRLTVDQQPVDRIELVTEVEARRLAQDVALAVQAALLYQTAPSSVFAAFCDSRIAGNWGQAFGTLGAATDFDAIIDRAMPC